MKYLETNSINPYYNLAFEEYVLIHYTTDDYLILWQNENTVVIGAHQNPYEEINFSASEIWKANIVRRITGGGAVYHDLGNLNFSYITDWNNGENSNYEHFLEPIVNAFAEIGLQVKLERRNDLLLEGKKISGSAQALVKDRILHHGTLLIRSNLDLIDQMLNVSQDKFLSKAIKSVRSRVTNIQDHLPNQVSVEDIKKVLLKYWSSKEEVEYITLKGNDYLEIESLELDKYRTWQWNFGRSPDLSYQNKKRFPGGAVEVNLDIVDGIIKACIINGDFLSLRSVEFVENTLIGKKYDSCTIQSLIDGIPIEQYFGGITKEELMSCIFNS